MKGSLEGNMRAHIPVLLAGINANEGITYSIRIKLSLPIINKSQNDNINIIPSW